MSSRAAASHALRRCAILVADCCTCCMESRGVRCTLLCVWFMSQLVLRTVHACSMLHRVRTRCILVVHVACCRLFDTCLAASGVVHVALGCCALHVVCCAVPACALRVVRCMLRNACCICAGAVFCDRNAAVGIVHVASCVLCTQQQTFDNVGCALHDAHSAVCLARMTHFGAFPPTL